MILIIVRIIIATCKSNDFDNDKIDKINNEIVYDKLNNNNQDNDYD